MALRFPRVVVVAVFVTIALCLAYISRDHFRYQPQPIVESPTYQIWGIEGLEQVIQVSDYHVRTKFVENELPVKQKTPLSMSFTDVDLEQPMPQLHAQIVTVPAQSYNTPDASSLLIGLATKLDRLRDSLPAFAHWAAGTRVEFVALIAPDEPSSTTVDEIKQLYKSRNVQITVVESALDWYDQYVSLLGVLHDHAGPHTKWACIMDDDTYFFSMKRVLAMLDKYDAKRPYYIGGLSENKETMDRLGYVGFGGAGIFFSIPLLKQLRPYVDDCIALPDNAGDLRIGHCITTYSTTKFTWEHYLFQMDLHGDVTGFYEAARARPVSTHHWKTWHFHDMVQVGAVGRICGNECVLQKYTTIDGWMLTNGFSLVKYSYSREEESQYIEGAMEHTWADTAWVIPTSWNYTLAPLRPKDTGKIQYVIEKIEEEDDRVTLYYVRRQNRRGQGIIRMMWAKPLSTTNIPETVS